MSRKISAVVCLLLASSTVFGQAPKKEVAGRTAGEAKELAPGMVFHWCPPGTFTMGSPASELGFNETRDSQEDQVKVRLSKGYWLGETEVTQDQWSKLMGTSPWKEQTFLKEGSSYPATNISHDDAIAFVKKLTDQERRAGRLPDGWHYALPTEAQWEYACRAGTTTKYSFGSSESDLGTYAWFDKNTKEIGEEFAHEVGMKKPNAWGLKDMHGNVWELCSDWWGYGRTGGADPVGPPNSKLNRRVLRGGSWFGPALGMRSALRDASEPADRSNLVGFRCAQVPSSK